MTHYSITRLAKEFGLSRSTLLHYDAIGLLKPKERTDANYRIYTETDYKKLEQICSLRRTGISLKEIKRLIDSDSSSVSNILQKRIDKINQEIQLLRNQQNIIIKLLGNESIRKSTRMITKEQWVDLLSSTGLDEEGMMKWHIEFEASMPEGHQDFLESLGLDNDEIKRIRKQSGKK